MAKNDPVLKSTEIFEDEGICSFGDEVENAIRTIYRIKTGREFETENDCEAMNDMREYLCQRLNGCYPAWISDDDGDDIPCCKKECEYGCKNCPMQEGNEFQEFIPEDEEDADECIKALIRLIRCDSAYEPDDDEMDDVMRTILCYNK